MSRIAKYPVELPKGVEFSQSGLMVTIKGAKGCHAECHVREQRAGRAGHRRRETRARPGPHGNRVVFRLQLDLGIELHRQRS